MSDYAAARCGEDGLTSLRSMVMRSSSSLKLFEYVSGCAVVD